MIDTTIFTLEKMKSANDDGIQMLMINFHLNTIHSGLSIELHLVD